MQHAKVSGFRVPGIRGPGLAAQCRRRRALRRALWAASVLPALAHPASLHAEEAQSIAFAIAVVPSVTGTARVETAYFEGMVDPDDCTAWYSDLPRARTWTWNNNGKNVTRFGLTVGFTLAEGGAEPRVASRCVSVDPENMAHARPTVNVELRVCELGPGKSHLRLDDIRQPGVQVHRITGEPDCP